MSALVLDGKSLAELTISQAQQVSDEITEATGRRTKLVVIQVGNDPASTIYVKRKETACKKAHIDVQTIHKPEDTTAMSLTILIDGLNNDSTVDGIMLQLPLPAHLEEQRQFIIDRIKPWKDVDGLTSYSKGALMNNTGGLRPCTPLGIMRLLNFNHISVKGKRVCIIGRSDLVGKPLAAMMLNANAVVTVCHSKMAEAEVIALAHESEIVVAAVGIPEKFHYGILNPRSVLIDVGINRVESGIVGDIDRNCYKFARAYTPVPGGVGQMTVATLVMNTLDARRMAE